MAFQEYPKAMEHPQYQPAINSGYRRNPDGSANNEAPGRPAKFPPVNVNNIDQEQQYASLGYRPVGTSDPEAYMRATIGANEPDGHVFKEYPKWLYQCDAYGMRSELVNSEAQAKKLGAGWHATPDLALADGQQDDDGDEQQVQEQPAAPKKASGVKAAPKAKRKYSARKPKAAKAVEQQQQPAA